MCYNFGALKQKSIFSLVSKTSVSLLFPGKFTVKITLTKFNIDSLYSHICFYLGKNDSRGKDISLAFSLNLTPIPPIPKPMFGGFILAKRFPVALTVTGGGSYERTTGKACSLCKGIYPG